MRSPTIRKENYRFPVLNGRTRYLLNLVQDNRKGIEAAAQQWRDGAQTDSQFIKVLEVRALETASSSASVSHAAILRQFGSQPLHRVPPSPLPVLPVLRRRCARRAPGCRAGAPRNSTAFLFC